MPKRTEEDWQLVDKELRCLGDQQKGYAKVMPLAEAHIAALEGQLKQAQKQRDRAEQKYDGACAMMAASPGPDGWEVVTAEDGQLSLQPVNWKDRAKEAETALAALIDYRKDILDSAWNTANERVIKAEEELELWHESCHELERDRDLWQVRATKAEMLLAKLDLDNFK